MHDYSLIFIIMYSLKPCLVIFDSDVWPHDVSATPWTRPNPRRRVAPAPPRIDEFMDANTSEGPSS